MNSTFVTEQLNNEDTVLLSRPFGPGDDFSLENSHVIPALIRKMHDAKVRNLESVEIWGTGTPRREFIFVDDLANGCIFVMDEYDGPEPINIGSGEDLSIKELAELTKELASYAGNLKFDTSKPDGMPLKVLDSSKLNRMGWRSRISIRSALTKTYNWFMQMERN